MFYDPAKTQFFKETLLTVVGQAFTAAAYQLEENEIHQARGLVRFRKRLTELGDDIYGWIEWQLLAFEQSPLARFRVQLLRNEGKDARAITPYSQRDEKNLAWVIWHGFEARVLPNDNFWWEFRTSDELPHQLANAGRLVFGYGVPWLEMRADE